LAKCRFESEELRKPAKHIASPLGASEKKQTKPKFFKI